MDKIDYKREYKTLYGARSNNVQFVEVPVMNYLMVQGEGEPGGKAHTEAFRPCTPWPTQ